MDADGILDRFYYYDRPGPGGATYLRARAVLGWGSTNEVDLGRYDPPPSPRIIGAADADGDGRAEVFAAPFVGASAEPVGIFRVVGKQLVRVQVRGPDGRSTAAFSIGRALTHASGIECSLERGKPPRLIELHANNFWDGDRWSWDRTTYEWRSGDLVYMGKVNGVMRGPRRVESHTDSSADEIGSPAFERWIYRYSVLRCGSLLADAK